MLLSIRSLGGAENLKFNLPELTYRKWCKGIFIGCECHFKANIGVQPIGLKSYYQFSD